MPKFNYKEFFIGSTTFCCCLPVRIGVIIMSLLSMLSSGILAVILWYEVSSTPDMSSGERAAFILASLFQTVLFAASMLGFSGAVARKQLFVMIYAYIIYVHLVLNTAVAIFLLFKITQGASTAITKDCQDAIQDEATQAQCSGVLKVAQDVYFVVAAVVLLVEMYGALVVARYVNQLKSQKRQARASRMSGFQLVPKGHRYSNLSSSQDVGVIYSPYTPQLAREFDPYEEVARTGHDAVSEPSYDYDGVPAHSIDVSMGYGGGTWTHAEISAEEKESLRQRDSEVEFEAEHEVDEDEARRGDSKSPAGPPFVPPRPTDDLPRYTLTDSPVNRASSAENNGT